MTETIKPQRGRPSADLTAKRRVQLIKLAERLGVAEARARDLRVDIGRAATEAAAEGASQRAIGEALGISQQAVAELLSR